MRVRLEPRKGNREAEEMFRYHLHRDGYVHVSERLDRWYVFHPNANTGFWVHPTKDPNWIVHKWIPTKSSTGKTVHLIAKRSSPLVKSPPLTWWTCLKRTLIMMYIVLNPRHWCLNSSSHRMVHWGEQDALKLHNIMEHYDQISEVQCTTSLHTNKLQSLQTFTLKHTKTSYGMTTLNV